MVNQTVFNSRPTRETDTVNEAGGTAYKMNTKHAIAQYAVTGCFNNTYYAGGGDQLKKIKELIGELPQNIETFKFLAKLAIYSRHSAFMKDMPTFLVAYMCNMKDETSVRSTDHEPTREIIRKVFGKVINNGKMLRNFVQIMRSGTTGRKSLGSFPKRLVKDWIAARDGKTLFRNSIGNNPSFADVIKMTHVKHSENEVIKYLLGQDLTAPEMGRLPEAITHYEAFKQYLKLSDEQKQAYNEESGKMKLPDVDFQFLTSLDLDTEHWEQLADKATWQQTRINLNTFKRHKALDNVELVKQIADKLKHPEQIKKAKAMPYQLLAARQNNEVNNHLIQDALEDALSISLENAPRLDGITAVFVDSSGSMGGSATGGYNSTMSCYDVAGLFATGILKTNPDAYLFACDTHAVPIKAYHRDSWLAIVKAIRKVAGYGGTDTSECIRHLINNNIHADNIVIISDGQSWAHHRGPMEEFNRFRKIVPKAKILCIDIQAYDSMQFDYDPAVLHVGGFNDSVFLLADKYFNSPDSDFVGAIEEVEI